MLYWLVQINLKLKIIICVVGRMDETAPQLQRFIEEAVKSNKRNADEIYFMVVRSIEVCCHYFLLPSVILTINAIL